MSAVREKQETKFFVEVSDGEFTKLRDATLEEMADAKKRQSKLAALNDQMEALKAEMKRTVNDCPHTVRYDAAGYPHDVRNCLGCGKFMGFI